MANKNTNLRTYTYPKGKFEAAINVLVDSYTGNESFNIYYHENLKNVLNEGNIPQVETLQEEYETADDKESRAEKFYDQLSAVTGFRFDIVRLRIIDNKEHHTEFRLNEEDDPIITTDLDRAHEEMRYYGKIPYTAHDDDPNVFYIERETLNTVMDRFEKRGIAAEELTA